MYIFNKKIYNYLLIGILYILFFNVYYPHSNFVNLLWFIGSYLSPSCQNNITYIFVITFLSIYLLFLSCVIYTLILLIVKYFKKW
jgi:hypothetical protein